ncbi:lipid-binding SYLF domain-containing protein [Nitrospirillum iridis]|uniref:Lipid-binding SYLF domain-containing protein n=1 Tax=Nitrospirillum iridis TaxID=765888 RepID=A0A7X0B2P1_9PROT|nr:lipid-binding SYLF domain-containing protein [Nitrospirillum iridis]MBB6254600.1 lipid-binding SYLF domain-containing protein [Nitrospirillum iridis]
MGDDARAVTPRDATGTLSLLATTLKQQKERPQGPFPSTTPADWTLSGDGLAGAPARPNNGVTMMPAPFTKPAAKPSPRSRILPAALSALMIFGAMTAAAPHALAAAAAHGTDQSNLVERARVTVDDLRKDKEFGNARELMKRAKGVLIVPQLIKGGFFVGGEGGDAVLLTRGPDGEFSYPAFYTLGSASFGLQIGVEQAELVMFIMSDKALASVLQDEFKIGAQAGLAVVTLGSTAEAATPTSLNGDIIVWSSASGAYAGLTLNGSILKPRDSWNEAYYGKPEPVSAIVSKRSAKNADADGLRRNLATIR